MHGFLQVNIVEKSVKETEETSIRKCYFKSRTKEGARLFRGDGNAARRKKGRDINMLIQKLNSSEGLQWSMYQEGEGARLPAVVPGSVYQDLLTNGKLEDPYYRDNELKALKVMENDFTYETHFAVSEGLLECERTLLHFDGIDTLADIFLNGVKVGSADNMHRIWEFPVRELLKPENNELKVMLHSPTRFIEEAYEKRPIEGSTDAMRGFPYLRKAHCMFGWDWGPRLPDAGIWREVSLLGIGPARLDGVYITQHHEPGKVTLSFRVDVDKTKEERVVSFGADEKKLAGPSWRVRVTEPGNGKEGRSWEYVHPAGGKEAPEDSLTIDAPLLWWPNGFGAQPLYQVRVELLCGDEVLDVWEKRIGLRTMTMRIEKDEYGESFAHEVNGVRIFAMGADYIPEDNILSRVTPERTFDLLLQAKNANYNCIRVWGGGNYPYDAFWDACDELGLIVWEDFMFACAVYDLTEEFEQSITAEFIDNIKRIRHHASLGLWCGNNEMEQFVAQGDGWIRRPKEKSDYVKMYEYILPKVLKKYDPNTFYWPASPSSGGAFDEPNAENRGDVHYWDVWHGNKPITEYRKFYFRYVSEFGFQSFPALKTVETFTEPEDRNIFSYVMEKHQRNSSANGKIMNYMEQTFLYPTDFDVTLYASQLLQAEAIRYGVEHFRRNRGRCMGAVIWQLNDCWPVASWSSIDYCGRWKALHYYAKRFFAPVMLSCAEEGILTQDTNPNAQPYEVKKSVQLCVANETMEEKKLKVVWSLRNSRSEILRGGEETVTVPALSSLWLDRQDCMDAGLYEDHVSYACYEADGAEPVSGGCVIFCAPKQYHFADPELTVRAEGDELVVDASAYARGVEIRNAADDMLLSDNYFDMDAGTRRVKILKGSPEGLQIRSVYNIR